MRGNWNKTTIGISKIIIRFRLGFGVKLRFFFYIKSVKYLPICIKKTGVPPHVQNHL